MFLATEADPKAWGAGLSGSPIIAFKDAPERSIVFLIPVEQWSDGTPATADGH